MCMRPFVMGADIMNLRWLFLPALCVVLGVVAQPAPAQDNCYDYCIYSCPTDSSRSECTNNCATRCSPGGDLSNTWSGSAPNGAIAYGKDSGAFGFAYNQRSSSAADHVALSNCAQHGQDCEIVLRLTHSCGAVAAGADGKFATGEGPAQDQAQNNALAACAQIAGGDCHIQTWTCSP